MSVGHRPTYLLPILAIVALLASGLDQAASPRR